MNRFHEKSKGAISILLALVMLPMFTFAGLIIDGTRIESAKSAAQGAGELALNAGLSEYDQTLLSVYGLFSLSSTPAELEMNLKMYFDNTLSAQVTDLESGSATKDALDAWSQDIVDGLFQGSTGTDDLTLSNVSNMTEMQTADFKAVGVAESTLDHPEVLERQIIEYMKYRGPVSLASGFMEKINILGAIPQQTEAVTAKVDYEKKMSTVQDACDIAYTALMKYKTDIETTKITYTGDGTGLLSGAYANSDGFNANINDAFYRAKENQRAAAEFYLLLNTPAFTDDDINPSVSINISGKTESPFTLDDYVTRYNELLTQLISTFKITDTDFIFRITDNKCIYSLWLWHKNIGIVNEFMAVATKIKDSSEMDSEDEYNKTEHTHTYEEAEKCISDGAEYTAYFARYDTFCDSVHNLYVDLAGAYSKNPADILGEYNTYCAQMIVDIIEATDALAAIKVVSAELKAQGTVWSGKNENLPEGETKESLTSDLESKSNSIDDAQIDALILILNNNLAHFQSVQVAIKGVTYHEIPVLPETIGDAASFYSTYKEKVTASLTNSTDVFSLLKKGTQNDASYLSYIQSAAIAETNAFYINKSVADFSPAQYTKLDTTDPQQEFFQFLITTCSQGVTESTTSSDKAESQKDTLNEMGNSAASATDPVPDQPAVSSGSIPALEAVSVGVPYVNTKVDSGSSDEAAADANTANMANTAGSMARVSEILSGAAETLRDNLYLMEYITTMFSYNTVALPVGADGKPMKPTTLSNVSIDEKNNQFYRAEVEYILWGNAKASDNVLATQASIYGIRLVLNSIYAFTNAEIKGYTLTAATAIAGWTGFGVPIVQTVLIFALAAAESALDLIDLNSGKEVAIYKTTSTWILKPSSIFSSVAGELSKELVNQLTTEAQKAANKFFEKVAQIAGNEITNIEEELTAFIESTEQSVIDSAVDTVMVPVEELARSIITSSENTTQDCAAYVTEQVDILVADLVDNDYGDTPQGIAKRAVVDYLANSGKSYLITSITECKQKYNAAVLDGVTDVTDEINGILETTFSEIIKLVTEPVKAQISAYSADLKSEVTSQIGAANEQAQKKIEDAANAYIGKMSNTGSAASLTNTATPETADSAGKGGLTMTYEDYLKVFILLATLAEKDTMLKRVGNLIECNMKYSEGSANFKDGVRFAKNPSFEMSEAYTMFGINATVNVRTTFLGGITFLSSSDSSGNPTNEYTSILGTYWQPIEYHGVTSY